MLQKEVEELKEQLGMTDLGQERYGDTARGGASVWLQVTVVGSGWGTHGGGDIQQARLGALCAFTVGACLYQEALLCHVLCRRVSQAPLSGRLDVPPLLSFEVLAAVSCLVTCLFVLQVGVTLLWPSI